MSAVKTEEKKLSLEEISEVNGGCIVDRGFWSRYWIVSDYTGNVIDTAFSQSTPTRPARPAPSAIR